VAQLQGEQQESKLAAAAAAEAAGEADRKLSSEAAAALDAAKAAEAKTGAELALLREQHTALLERVASLEEQLSQVGIDYLRSRLRLSTWLLCDRL
jgi:hypothetical protein